MIHTLENAEKREKNDNLIKIVVTSAKSGYHFYSHTGRKVMNSEWCLLKYTSTYNKLSNQVYFHLPFFTSINYKLSLSTVRFSHSRPNGDLTIAFCTHSNLTISSSQLTHTKLKLSFHCEKLAEQINNKKSKIHISIFAELYSSHWQTNTQKQLHTDTHSNRAQNTIKSSTIDF